MLTQEEQNLLDETVKKIENCNEFDQEQESKILDDFENSLPDGELKRFFNDCENALAKFKDFDDEDLEEFIEDESNFKELIETIISVRDRFKKDNRPSFIPKRLAQAYKERLQGSIDELTFVKSCSKLI